MDDRRHGSSNGVAASALPHTTGAIVDSDIDRAIRSDLALCEGLRRALAETPELTPAALAAYRGVLATELAAAQERIRSLRHLWVGADTLVA